MRTAIRHSHSEKIHPKAGFSGGDTGGGKEGRGKIKEVERRILKGQVSDGEHGREKGTTKNT